MNTKKLYSAIAAFNAVISDTPDAEDINYTEDDTADFDAYSNALYAIVGSVETLMGILIKGVYYALIKAPEHITPVVFGTERSEEHTSELQSPR